MSSSTEQFYAAICSKLGITRKWSELHPMEQMQFVNHLNGILQIVHNERRF